MKSKRKWLSIMGLVLGVALIGTGCGSSTASETTEQKTPEASAAEPAETKTDAASIVAVGSSAMQPLVDEIAKRYMEENKNVQVQVQGGGSGTGLSQVSSGGADIGNSDVFAEEKEGIDATQIVDNKICVVGMGAVVNKEVGISNLTSEQLIGIFTGEIKNWKEVGGKDLEVLLVNRPKSSGTRSTFVKYALNGKEEAESITEESSGNVKKIVSETPGAVGYLAFSYFDDSITAVAIDGVEPKAENIYTGDYKVWAYQHSYTKGEATGAIKSFIEYMQAQESVIVEMGYIPMSKMQIERDASGNITQK